MTYLDGFGAKGFELKACHRMLGRLAVRYIYRYHTGFAPFFNSFWSGMVKWYAKVVLIV